MDNHSTKFMTVRLTSVLLAAVQVGIGDLSTAQQRSHFALWALVKAPLLIGANLEEISEDSLAILKATEVRRIHVDLQHLRLLGLYFLIKSFVRVHCLAVNLVG